MPQPNFRCDFAIYRDVDSSCRLVQSVLNSQISGSAPEFADEEGCKVINNKVCENGGTKFGTGCTCLQQFTGQFCETVKTDACQSRQWRLVTEQDLDLLVTSNIPLKLISDTEVLSVSTFDKIDGRYVAQANGYLATESNEPYFTDPYEKEFLLLEVESIDGVVETETLVLARVMGDVFVSIKEGTANYRLYMPGVIDDNRLVYDQEANIGSIYDVTDALSNGNALLQRGIKSVFFNHAEGLLSYQEVDTRLKLDSGSEPDWIRPLLYDSSKTDINSTTCTNYAMDHRVGLPQQMTPYPTRTTPSPPCEIDRCWRKTNASYNDPNILYELKAYSEGGYQMRVVLNGEVSSDLVVIFTTDDDFFVQMATSFSTPLYNDALSTQSNIQTATVSHLKTYADCSLILNTTTVLRRNYLPDVDSVDFYVTTRTWTKVYSLDSDKTPIYGNQTKLHEVAFQGNNIRICLHFDHYNSKICLGVGTITKVPSGRILFQLNSIVSVNISPEGKFSGFYHDTCAGVVRMLGSDGWVVRLSTGGGLNANVYTTHNEIQRIDWFFEE